MEKFFYILAKGLGIFLFKLFFYWEVKGRENIPKKGKVIIAANHLSYLDPVIIGVASPRRLHYLAKASIFKIPVLNLIVKIYGAIPIEREKEYSISLRKGIEILNEGKGLVIFPEGTRNPGNKMIEPKKGVAFLSYKTGASVIPAKLIGTDKALGCGGKFIKPTKIKIIFGSPVKVENKNYMEQSYRIMEEIEKLK